MSGRCRGNHVSADSCPQDLDLSACKANDQNVCMLRPQVKYAERQQCACKALHADPCLYQRQESDDCSTIANVAECSEAQVHGILQSCTTVEPAGQHCSQVLQITLHMPQPGDGLAGIQNHPAQDPCHFGKVAVFWQAALEEPHLGRQDRGTCQVGASMYLGWSIDAAVDIAEAARWTPVVLHMPAYAGCQHPGFEHRRGNLRGNGISTVR